MRNSYLVTLLPAGVDILNLMDLHRATIFKLKSEAEKNLSFFTTPKVSQL